VPSVVSQLELLEQIPVETRSVLAQQGRRRAFRSGTHLVRQGDHSERIYLIISGHVRVERGHPHLLEPVVLAELGPGAVIGQLGVPDGEDSPITATATEDIDTLELRPAALARAALHRPGDSGMLLHLRSVRPLSETELEHVSAPTY
jgi:CRP-like cAMP-binding protein